MTTVPILSRRAAARPTPRSRNGTGTQGGQARAASSSSPRAPLHAPTSLSPFGCRQTGRNDTIARRPAPMIVAPLSLLISKRLGAAAPSPVAAPIFANPILFGRRDFGRSPRASVPALSRARGVSRCVRVFSFGVPRAPGVGRMHRSAPKIRAIASAVMRTATATGRGAIPQVLARPVAPLRKVAA